MYAVIRRYTDAEALADAMENGRDEVEELITGVAGFVAYYAVRSGRSVTTITICRDRAGTQDSTRRAAEWVRQNTVGGSVAALEVSEGEVFLNFE